MFYIFKKHPYKIDDIYSFLFELTELSLQLGDFLPFDDTHQIVFIEFINQPDIIFIPELHDLVYNMVIFLVYSNRRMFY